MPIRKLIDERLAHLNAQIDTHKAEKKLLIEQMEAFNVAAFAYGEPASEHDAPEWEANADKKSNTKLMAEAKASKKSPRKARVESGPRRTGLKDEVLQHIMAGDGTTPIKGIALAVNAKTQSVKVAIESLLKADKIAPSGAGGYHPMETAVGQPAAEEIAA